MVIRTFAEYLMSINGHMLNIQLAYVYICKKGDFWLHSFVGIGKLSLNEILENED